MLRSRLAVTIAIVALGAGCNPPPGAAPHFRIDSIDAARTSDGRISVSTHVVATDGPGTSPACVRVEWLGVTPAGASVIEEARESCFSETFAAGSSDMITIASSKTHGVDEQIVVTAHSSGSRVVGADATRTMQVPQ